MDYEDLRRVQRLETGSASLAQVDAQFYGQVADLLSGQRASGKDSKIFDNSVRTLRDIFERREQKLVLQALRAAHGGAAVDGVPTEEKEFFNKLVEALRQNRSSFEELLSGEVKHRSEALSLQNIRDIPTIESNGSGVSKQKEAKSGEPLNNVLVRIIKKVPKFMASNASEIGPFEANEIVKLPRQEAQLLSSKNFAELI